MRLLLDTHIAIWTLLGSPRLSRRAHELIDDPDNRIFVSAIGIWEIAIKRATGQRDAPPFSASDAMVFCAEAGFTMLGVTAAHGAAVESLPPLHRDPFDRMMIAQASTEPLVLLTHDADVSQYSQAILLV